MALLKILEGTVASVPPQGGRKHPQQELIPIDTTNILFICGGAFDGLEKIVEARMDASAIGFNAEVKSKSDINVGDAFKRALPQDFVKFGLIPEFIGRVPITVSLDSLSSNSSPTPSSSRSLVYCLIREFFGSFKYGSMRRDPANLKIR